MEYVVKYGYRTDVDERGMCQYSMPTHFGEVMVDAGSEQDARRKAMDHAHASHNPCAHVSIQSVKNKQKGE